MADLTGEHVDILGMMDKTPITDAIDVLIRTSSPGIITALDRARRLEESHANLLQAAIQVASESGPDTSPSTGSMDKLRAAIAQAAA
jgi:hypothetical protein